MGSCSRPILRQTHFLTSSSLSPISSPQYLLPMDPKERKSLAEQAREETNAAALGMRRPSNEGRSQMPTTTSSGAPDGSLIDQSLRIDTTPVPPSYMSTTSSSATPRVSLTDPVFPPAQVPTTRSLAPVLYQPQMRLQYSADPGCGQHESTSSQQDLSS